MNAPLSRRLRAAVVLGATTAALAACGSGDRSQQNNPLGFDNGVAPAGPDDGLETVEAVALFGIVPLILLLVVAGLVWLPGMVRNNRYRPAKGWNAAPLWFGGPPDPAAAVEAASPADVTRGGASGSW